MTGYVGVQTKQKLISQCLDFWFRDMASSRYHIQAGRCYGHVMCHCKNTLHLGRDYRLIYQILV